MAEGDLGFLAKLTFVPVIGEAFVEDAERMTYAAYAPAIRPTSSSPPRRPL
jgi:hypothetical protein